MRATDVLTAVKDWHRGAAFVPEVVINDDTAFGFQEDGKRVPAVRRIDILMFDSLQRTAIEIKVDKRDVGRESWEKIAPWKRVTHRYIYAVPAGLVDIAPIYGCGLWWVHDDGHIEIRRKAVINRYPEHLPQHVVQALAYRACGRTTIERQTTESGVS